MKKLNKFFAVLVALAMMATLCVSMAFAAEGDLTEAQTSTDAKLVKYLKLATGETKPADEFDFTFTGLETSTITATEANAVAPKDVKIATSEMTDTVYNKDGATVAKALKVADLFDLTKFTKAGVYKYEVDETDTGTKEIGGGVMTYDEAKYIVTIFVKNGKNGLEISDITVQKGNEQAEKEDATNDPTDSTDPDVTTDKDLSTSGFTFNNSYTSEVTKDNDDGILKITKTVAGDYGDKTQKFPFNVTLNIPSTADQAYVASYTEAGTQKTATAVDGKISFVANLADGEAVVFKTLPAGTTYTIEEDLAKSSTTGEGEDAVTTFAVKNHDKYTAKVDLTDVDTDKTTTNATAAGANVSASGLVADTDTKNIGAYTNTYADSTTTPTGILISNLPYIALALVAIGGLVAYVVVRRRQSDEA